jgi:hypothetical protein
VRRASYTVRGTFEQYLAAAPRARCNDVLPMDLGLDSMMSMGGGVAPPGEPVRPLAFPSRSYAVGCARDAVEGFIARWLTAGL